MLPRHQILFSFLFSFLLIFPVTPPAFGHDNHDVDGTLFYSWAIQGSFHADDIPGACERSMSINLYAPYYRYRRLVDIDISRSYTSDGRLAYMEFTCTVDWIERFRRVSGTTSYDRHKTYCNNAESPATSQLNLSDCLPSPSIQQCEFGNPILLNSGAKRQDAVDWTSRLDQRFRLERTYLSKADLLDMTFRGMGQGWSLPAMARLERTSATATRWAASLGGGEVYHFEALTSSETDPVQGDHGYRLVLNVAAEGGDHVLSAADGTKYVFAPSAPTVSLLKEIRWPDGYAIAITHAANTFPTALEDNRGQRAEFVWNELINPDSHHALLEKILVDTSFDGLSFSADLSIDYVYEVDPVSKSVSYLTDAVVSEAQSATELRKSHYTYNLVRQSENRGVLTSVSDGRIRWAEERELPVLPINATSSSRYPHWGGPPDMVYDGLKGGHNYTHTLNGEHEFIEIDFGRELTPTQVIVTNRASDGSRLNGAVLVGYDASHSEVYRSAPISGARNSSVHTFTPVAVNNVQYLAVEHSNQLLHVSEIEVIELVPAGYYPFPASSFEYENHTSSYLPRAISTQHFDGADAYTVGAPISNANGYSISVTNPLGKETIYSLEEAGGQHRVVSIEGVSTLSCLPSNSTISYDASGRKIEQIERNGSRTVIVRDSLGRILSRTEDADGLQPRVTTYTWPADDSRKPLTRSTSELHETFTYDPDGMLTVYSQEDVRPGSPDFGEVRMWTYTYTALASGLKVLTSVDGPGLVADGINDVSTYTHNARGQVLTATDPNGLTQEVLTYGVTGQPTLIRDHQGFDWALSYDLEGQLIESVFDPGGLNEATTYSYDIIGQMISSTDPLGRTWDYTYDEAKRLIATEAPSGETIQFDHDAMGNVVRTEYADSVAVMRYLAETQYDELGRILQSLGANGQTTGYSHDVEDNLATITDASSLTTTLSYDPLNRMTDLVDRANFTTLMDHDDSDQVTSFTDPRGLTTSFAYNGFGDLVSETSPDRGTMTYTYDKRGLVTSMTDGRGVVTNYAYDDGGRLIAKTFPSDPTLDQSFTYHNDPAQPQNIGTLATVTDQSGQTNYANDPARGAFALDQRTMGGVSYSTTYDSDAVGQTTAITYPGGSQALMAYDQDGNLTGVQWRVYDPQTSTYAAPVDVVSGMTYLPFGPMASMTYGDGGVLTATFDMSYRLTGLLDVRSGITLRDVTYGWTTRDNLESVTDNLDPTQNETFGYSPREFLSSADGAWGELDWLYDGVGNRTQQMSYAGGVTETDVYTYPATSNRLDQIVFGSGGGRTLTYDAAGNVTFDNRNGPGYGYNYDAAGRMSSFAINGVIQAEYAYNALGQQVVRRLTQAGQTIHSLHDREGNRIAEYLYDESLQTSSLIREYIWANGTVVGVYENGTLYFVRTDHIGRPVFATDVNGTVAWEASYLPFGGIEASSGPNPNPNLRFPGQWFQSETGLHQNWMRDYDPTTGRYMQADPLGLVDGASVYGYALQNPGRYVDPRGEFLINPITIGLVRAGIAYAIRRYWAQAAVAVTGVAGGIATAPSIPDPVAEEDECDPDGCPYEVESVAGFRKLNRRELRQFIQKFGHPHDWKDDSDEDLWRNPRNNCVYIADKQGIGYGRLVGQL